jgi:hypothetical protein
LIVEPAEKSVGVGWERGGLLVERLDLFGDAEVLVGDRAVSDLGVDEGHGEALVARRALPMSDRDLNDAYLTNTIVDTTA